MVQSCREFHTLPRSGGFLDQDSYFVYMYYKIIGFENIRAQLDNAAKNMGIGGP